MKALKIKFLFFFICFCIFSCQSDLEIYTMPEEADLHEATWLEWPHEYQFGRTYRNRLDPIWIAMTKELRESEIVKIIAYDQYEVNRITKLLVSARVQMSNISFHTIKNDDVWARDNLGIYVRNRQGDLVVEDWGFNAWGRKYEYANSDIVPIKMAQEQSFPLLDLNKILVLEGGSFEIDGKGTFLATKSAILNDNRNPGVSQADAEKNFRKYLGVSNFIWLDGVAGKDITDMHIDGFAKFVNSTTMVTMNSEDLEYWEVPYNDIITLYASKNKDGQAYKFVYLPLSKNNVVTTYGKNIGYRGSYLNYYIANTKILVPNYNDPNDSIANQIIQSLYPNRKVVGINASNLIANGGMIHCVTQQQPKR